jgi:hypothetical protein
LVAVVIVVVLVMITAAATVVVVVVVVVVVLVIHIGSIWLHVPAYVKVLQRPNGYIIVFAV